jgi:putative effector of murein hydrolase LrgA (UPF0299 family)
LQAKLWAHIPIPGPIIGLLLLFALLQGRTFVDPKTHEQLDTIAVAQVATPLLRHLAILFVPSGVGVLEYFHLFSQHGPALLIVLVASTLVTMAAAALAFAGSQSLARSLQTERSIYKCASLLLRQSTKSRSFHLNAGRVEMSTDAELTTWLSSSPLLWLTVTLCVWLASEQIAIAAGRHPFVNPLLISVIAIALLLKATGTSYATYFSGAQFIQFLIGPAVVAIAVPLFKNWYLVKQNVVPILTGAICGMHNRHCRHDSPGARTSPA